MLSISQFNLPLRCQVTKLHIVRFYVGKLFDGSAKKLDHLCNYLVTIKEVDCSYLQKKCCTEACHESINTSMIKIPASPQEELPILSTVDSSGDVDTDFLLPLCIELYEVVLMATINPASTTGRTKPELHPTS